MIDASVRWIVELLENKWVLALLTGIAGASLTHYFNSGRQQTELAFKLLEQFFAKHEEIGKVKGFLVNPASLSDTESFNRVIAIGDWFETLSLLCRRRVANGGLLRKVGVVGEMRRFRELAEKANGELKEALVAWEEMKAITSNKWRLPWTRN